MTSSRDAFEPLGRDAWPSAARGNDPVAATSRPAAAPALARPPAPHDAPSLEARSVEVARSWSIPEMHTLDREASRARTPEDEAFALGLAEGLRQGEARARAHITRSLETLGVVAAQLEAARERFASDRERNVSGLALAVARQIVQREIVADPAIVRDLVNRALALMPTESPLEVRLSVLDLAVIRPELEELAAAGRSSPVQWNADPALERGSFVLEGPARIVDGRVDVALRALFERLEHE